MNWDAIGAVGEIPAALAVVATLVFLSAQIRQNNRMIQREAHMDRMRHISDPLIGSPSQLAGIFREASRKRWFSFSDDAGVYEKLRSHV